MSERLDHYQLLGIEPTASTREIKEAYRKLALQFHPDVNEMDPVANEKMRFINEAFTTLTNPAKRKQYDVSNGYGTLAAKFSVGDLVKVNFHSNSPYRERTGFVDKNPDKDNFRFWYTVRFEVQGMSTVSRFAEEELSTAEE
jgi:curved DNA-binding protein CbpA